MSPYHPELLATPVPRYTSYPTAADFHEDVGSIDMASALDQVQASQPVSLYVHIPFCREICWYCGCNTGATGRGDRLTAYLARLSDEIALVGRRLDGRGRVTRIAFGGGSPNAVAPAGFAALLGTVRSAFDARDAVVSVEIDPRSLDAAWAAMLGDCGVERASLGVQTLAPAVQARIGRVQSPAMIERSVHLLREAGITSLNFDLMYGLPGQSNDDLIETLDQSIIHAPDRLSVFGYAHVPHLIARQRRIDATQLPDAAQRFIQAGLANETLVAAGYVAVGFDHFARPTDPLAIAARAGRVGRNFQGFTDDLAEVTIGLGVSAISAFPDRLLQNEKHSGRYHLAIGNGEFATSFGCRRSADDRGRAGIITAILASGNADAGIFAHDATVRARLRPFETAGLVAWHGPQLVLTPQARPYARSIAAVFDGYRQASRAALSCAV